MWGTRGRVEAGDQETERTTRLHAQPLTHRYFTDGAFDSIAVTAGIIQTAVYADFGYIVSVRGGRKAAA